MYNNSTIVCLIGLLNQLICNVQFTVQDRCLESKMLRLLNITLQIYEFITDVFMCVAAVATLVVDAKLPASSP